MNRLVGLRIVLFSLLFIGTATAMTVVKGLGVVIKNVVQQKDSAVTMQELDVPLPDFDASSYINEVELLAKTNPDYAEKLRRTTPYYRYMYFDILQSQCERDWFIRFIPINDYLWTAEIINLAKTNLSHAKMLAQRDLFYRAAYFGVSQNERDALAQLTPIVSFVEMVDVAFPQEHVVYSDKQLEEIAQKDLRTARLESLVRFYHYLVPETERDSRLLYGLPYNTMVVVNNDDRKEECTRTLSSTSASTSSVTAPVTYTASSTSASSSSSSVFTMIPTVVSTGLVTTMAPITSRLSATHVTKTQQFPSCETEIAQLAQTNATHAAILKKTTPYYRCLYFTASHNDGTRDFMINYLPTNDNFWGTEIFNLMRTNPAHAKILAQTDLYHRAIYFKAPETFREFWIDDMPRYAQADQIAFLADVMVPQEHIQYADVAMETLAKYDLRGAHIQAFKCINQNVALEVERESHSQSMTSSSSTKSSTSASIGIGDKLLTSEQTQAKICFLKVRLLEMRMLSNKSSTSSQQQSSSSSSSTSSSTSSTELTYKRSF